MSGFGADYDDNTIWWRDNPYPTYDQNISWIRCELKHSSDTKHHDQIAGDFDGDGDVELVFWNQEARKLFIADLLGAPKKRPDLAIYCSFLVNLESMRV